MHNLLRRFVVLVATLVLGVAARAQPPTLEQQLATLPDSSNIARRLDLSRLELKVYEAVFSRPLRFIHEAPLFDGDAQKPLPADVEWVLAGQATADIDDGRLRLRNQYSATDSEGAARGTSHIRKNYGSHLVAKGIDLVAGQGPGPHEVRLLKVREQITVEVNGRIAVR